MKFYEEYNSESENLNDIEQYQYISLKKLPNGIKIILNDNGRELLNDTDDDKIKSEEIANDLFDDVQGNSEYDFHQDLGDMGFGLTDAPGITYGYHYDDNNEYNEYGENAEVYYYNYYMLKNFIEELLEDGFVEFHKA
jgi:hypothetical protein